MKKPKTRIQLRNEAIILGASLDVFSQFGFRGSTLDQISEAAGLSKANLLYYFPSKEAIHAALLAQLLETWIDPLKRLDPTGDPVEELLAYAHRKLDMSKRFPRESRLFANEILQGAPHINNVLQGELRDLTDQTHQVITKWVEAGAIRPVDPYHLIFTIWALTQHYADFAVQVRAIMGDQDPFESAGDYLETLLRRLLTP
ncbi:TetR family transcriptional regulator C-terminal domain-containing protein [Yoonia litorea]|uniref:Transcriptional regulator, TetR family n=1 Tax=Yoonia litorea TaxID=1123755 RepID=A0A1I6LQ44_9RHOB|nr:TetR family transcriptional regulator C-terminal domain-containing protein [Yoonia litorea]SFS05596.1 transcriptional regulator, TetR family [Yoonia litorea]